MLYRYFLISMCTVQRRKRKKINRSVIFEGTLLTFVSFLFLLFCYVNVGFLIFLLFRNTEITIIFGCISKDLQPETFYQVWGNKRTLESDIVWRRRKVTFTYTFMNKKINKRKKWNQQQWKILRKSRTYVCLDNCSK